MNSRGTGRGARKAGNMREPDKAALEKLNQEKASLARSDTQSPPTSQQVTDANSARTTTGEGKPPPLVEALKKSVQSGVKVSTEAMNSSDMTVTMFNKQLLNPEAPVFSPTTRLTSSTSSHPIYTKHPIPTTTSSTTSKLDPKSKEFVPSVFSTAVSSMSNGNPDLYGNGDMIEEELSGYLDVKMIMRGFERAAPTEQKDSSSEPILKGAAEMLLKVFLYPGSFDELGEKFQDTLNSWEPSENTLINLAEMLVHWGVNMPDLRYAACRVSHIISEMKGAEKFKKLLIKRLQKWHIKSYDKVLSTEEDKYMFANYSGFCAEFFAKFDVKGQPIEVMATCIFKYVLTLLDLKEDCYVREACNILKLTGSNLVLVSDYETEINPVIKAMNELAMDTSLTNTCTSLIMQVLELYGSQWSSPASPVNPSSLESGKKLPEGNSGLNTDATPFVPSEPLCLTETFYGLQVMQQPVTCAADWDEFVGEDQPEEEYDDDVVENEDEYDGLDPEIELEMEAFIEEIEEHLMLQDFDPELHQED